MTRTASLRALPPEGLGGTGMPLAPQGQPREGGGGDAGTPAEAECDPAPIQVEFVSAQQRGQGCPLSTASPSSKAERP